MDYMEVEEKEKIRMAPVSLAPTIRTVPLTEMVNTGPMTGSEESEPQFHCGQG